MSCGSLAILSHFSNHWHVRPKENQFARSVYSSIVNHFELIILILACQIALVRLPHNMVYFIYFLTEYIEIFVLAKYLNVAMLNTGCPGPSNSTTPIGWQIPLIGGLFSQTSPRHSNDERRQRIPPPGGYLSFLLGNDYSLSSEVHSNKISIHHYIFREWYRLGHLTDLVISTKPS